jgi:ABC-type molybdate transport system substrate-binding protein
MSISTRAPFGHTASLNAARTVLGLALAAVAAGAVAQELPQRAASAAVSTSSAVTVHAAGSLRAALTEAARAFEHQSGTQVALNFGASGLLKDKLLGGEPGELFASANMEHPQALAAAGRARSVQPFARNALCLLGAPGFSLQGREVAQRLLDPALRVATSTPVADPAGDYAWRFFERIESSGAGGPGSAQQLKQRALQLVGGPGSPTAPPDRSLYAQLLGEGRADVFVTYCTNAALAARENPALPVLSLPPSLDISALYGLAVLQGASPAAEAFATFLRGEGGQAVLRRYGFSAP